MSYPIQFYAIELIRIYSKFLRNITHLNKLQITRMKVIAGSGMAAFNFTIDGHHMWILKLDGQPVVPTKTDEFIINAAQRVDIAVCRKSKT